MKKSITLTGLMALIALTVFLSLNNRNVRVIDAHHNPFSAAILVSHLPVFDINKIDWWVKNKPAILSQYHIPAFEKGGPEYITVYAFDGRYHAEEGDDRLCFEDIPLPSRCIDRDILVVISRNRDREERFTFAHQTYVRTKAGGVVRVAR